MLESNLKNMCTHVSRLQNVCVIQVTVIDERTKQTKTIVTDCTHCLRMENMPVDLYRAHMPRIGCHCLFNAAAGWRSYTVYPDCSIKYTVWNGAVITGVISQYFIDANNQVDTAVRYCWSHILVSYRRVIQNTTRHSNLTMSDVSEHANPKT